MSIYLNLISAFNMFRGPNWSWNWSWTWSCSCSCSWIWSWESSSPVW